MPEIGTLIDFVGLTKIVSSDVDQNFADIRTAFNESAVLTDAAKTISVTHTFTQSQKFDGGATFGAAVTMSSTLAVTGAVTLSDTLSATGSVTINQSGSDLFARLIGPANRSLYIDVAGNDTTSDHLAFRYSTDGGAAYTEGGRMIAGRFLWGTTSVTGAAVGGIRVAAASQFDDTLTVTGVTTGTGGFTSGSAHSLVRDVSTDTLGISGDTTASTGANYILYGASHATTANLHRWRRGTVEQMRLTGGDVLAIGTTVTTGASAGDVVLANAKALRGVRPSGTGTLPMISLDADDHVVLGGGVNTVMMPYRSPYTAAAIHNGTVMVDSATVGRFVFYAGGNRYYVTGTAF